GGIRPPIRIADDAGGEPSVAIGDYQSEADEDASAREREESKRLLYVALTRARDRLYLSAALKDGVCRMTRGSLREVLPASARALFVSAGLKAGQCIWSAARGRTHAFAVPGKSDEPLHFTRVMAATTVVDDFAPFE